MSNYFYLVRGGLNAIQKQLYSENMSINHINLEQLFIHPFDENLVLIINSFRDVSIIVDKTLMELINQDRIPANLYEYLITPNNENINDFAYRVDENSVLHNNYQSFIIAITYKCNLHCTYCYQQNDNTLNKMQISDENLQIILDSIVEFKRDNPEKIIDIGLFGGEPLLLENEQIIDKVLAFCLDNKFKLHITTNGTNLNYYKKKLIIYRGIISSINTTIDSIENNTYTRSDNKSSAKSSQIIENSQQLLKYGVSVNISTNVDRHNVGMIQEIYNYFKEIGLFSFERFRWDIGRVDDRLNETGYGDIISETEILCQLSKLKHIPNNMHAAFLKSIYPMCKHIKMTYNQTELKGTHNYCWASSNIDNVYYIDSDLNVFRCTYTVGRKKYSIFKFSLDEINKHVLHNRTYIDYPICINCKIGGYCSGGCALSFDACREKQCNYELKNFECFIKKIYIPAIKECIVNAKN